MKEQKAILEAYDRADKTRRMALATVVRVRGSSYRSPGARMLITDDGTWTGSISGGCLEGDALRKARQVMTTNTPVAVSYDTSEESNQNLGISLGCNGIIDVLIEPVTCQHPHDPVTLFRNVVAEQQPVALATVFSNGSLQGEKMLIRSDGECIVRLSSAALNKKVSDDLVRCLETHRSETKAYLIGREIIEVFIEVIQPTVSLLIFGAGFDARPVCQLAKSLGWEVSVTDECVAHIAPLFFPNADKLSLCNREFVSRDFDITPYTACVLMSHNYAYDRDVLKKLLTTPTPYIGILGPRKRFDKMLNEYVLQGLTLTADDHQRIHSPIGLDIGAETPDEIALSIIAEIQSRFTGRPGGFLKDRPTPIHQRDDESDQVIKQVYREGWIGTRVNL